MKTLYVMGVIVIILVVWVIYGYYSTQGIEKPKYAVTSKQIGYEVRVYEPQIVAETKVKGSYAASLNVGFRQIADYIFGNNTARFSIAMTAPVGETVAKAEPIAMTAPVLERGTSDVHTISFVMPSAYTLETIPKPNNKEVVLRAVPRRKVAALTFSWSTSAENVARQKAQLLAFLKRDDAVVIGEPEAAFYNPPWTPPFMLHNEILVEIK